MEFSFIISAFIAGLLMFLAPCTLPLVPAYLGFISGVSMDDLKNPARSKSARLKILLNGFFFILGFSTVFIMLGSVAGFAGKAFFQFRNIITRVGGAFVILFGLFTLKAVTIPIFSYEHRMAEPRVFRRGTPANSFVLGASFALGWTPCIGPILGSILFLAASTATIFQGIFLLSVFSLGLAIPFIIIAGGIGFSTRFMIRFSAVFDLISTISGVFLIILGFLLLTDNMSILTSYGFRVLRFINYERLLDYL